MRYLAVLETMWDWRGMTSSAGYVEEAPRFFRINPENFSGKRLYQFIGGVETARLQVTNVCPQIVSGPNHHGTPSVGWLTENLEDWLGQVGTSTVLVCGRIAQGTFDGFLGGLDRRRGLPGHRVVYLPHPAARNWTRSALESAEAFIRFGSIDLRLRIDAGRLRARRL